jgi:hypothetical protein
MAPPADTGNPDTDHSEDAGPASRFLNQLETDRTRRAYRRDLEVFFEEFLGKKAPSLQAARLASRGDLLLFLQHRGSKDEGNTLRRRATALASFYRWLREEGHLETIPFKEGEGGGKAVQAARKKQKGPPQLENLPESFFEPASWLEEALGRDIRRTLKLRKGESVPLLKVPVSIFYALEAFSKKAAEKTPEDLASVRTLELNHPERPLRIEIEHRPEEDLVQSSIHEKTLRQIQKGGPDPSFSTEGVLKNLAFLRDRGWHLPGPLFAQLRQMATRALEGRAKDRLQAPTRGWEAVFSEETWEAAAREIGAVLAGPLGVRPGEKINMSAQLPSSRTFMGGLP